MNMKILLLGEPYHLGSAKFPLPNSAQVPVELSLFFSHLAKLDLELPTQQIV